MSAQDRVEKHYTGTSPFIISKHLTMQRANLIHKHIKHVNAKLAECGAEVEGMLTPTLAQVTRFISTNFHRIAVNRKASLNCSVS